MNRLGNYDVIVAVSYTHLDVYKRQVRVQELRKNKRRPTRTGKTNMFSGIVRCADCGEKLYY